MPFLLMLNDLGFVTSSSCSGLRKEHMMKWKYYDGMGLEEFKRKHRVNGFNAPDDYIEELYAGYRRLKVRVLDRLHPSVTIQLPNEGSRKIYLNLKRILYGSGWEITYPTSYRYRCRGTYNIDRCDVPFYDRRKTHSKKMFFHLYYTTKTDDNGKIRAWKRLISLLEKRG